MNSTIRFLTAMAIACCAVGFVVLLGRDWGAQTRQSTCLLPRVGLGSNPKSRSPFFNQEGLKEIGFVPDAQVLNQGGHWFIRGKKSIVDLDPSNLRVTVQAGGLSWSFLPSSPGDLIAKSGENNLTLRLADAPLKEVRPYRTGYLSGVQITLAGFEPASSLDLTIQIFLGLEGRDEDLSVQIIASDGATRAREIIFPPSIDPGSFDRSVVPFMQGMLLPKDWPTKVRLYDELSYSRGLYMPWWGHERSGQRPGAVLVLLETPMDGGIRFSHPAGGPTQADVRWVHSLGRWAYPRSVRYIFMEKGNYVTLAKRYRRYAQDSGKFVSLKEKITKNPAVERLLGSPFVFAVILEHIVPESEYYHKDNPALNHVLVTFDQAVAQLEALAEKGIKRGYVHLKGWGFRGYDNLHPDILPPSPEAGGWDGMRQFADACKKLGFLVAFHDNYRDYYADAPSYDSRNEIVNENGSHPEHAIWYGGKQSILCSRFAPGYIRRNYGEILSHAIKPDGVHLDVFSVVPGDECYDREHPVTRAESLRFRAECFDFIRGAVGVASSEEPTDWSIPYLDLVYHAPYAVDSAQGGQRPMGIPIPLHSLVYHDALVVPWSLGKGPRVIAKIDEGFLDGLGNGGIPLIYVKASAEELAKAIAMCALNERVGLLELVNHEFLDDAYLRQRFTYADGTTVSVDFQSGSYVIAPPIK